MSKSMMSFLVRNGPLTWGTVLALFALAVTACSKAVAQPVQLEFDTELQPKSTGFFRCRWRATRQCPWDSIDGYGFVNLTVGCDTVLATIPAGAGQFGKAIAGNQFRQDLEFWADITAAD
jgi:hypothetical protein